MNDSPSFGRRIVRVGGVVARALMLIVAFALALAGAALLHIGLPSARRIAVRELNAVLRPEFVGTITVEEISGLSILGVRGLSVHVDGGDGSRLLYAHGAEASISPIRVLRSLLLGKGPLVFDVRAPAIDYVEACLDTDKTGELKLSHAFDPKVATPEPSTPGRGLRLSFSKIALRHAWLHGAMAGAPLVDADLDRVKASLLVDPAFTQIDVSQLTVQTRSLPANANVGGDAEARVNIPSGNSPMSLHAAFHGLVGTLPTSAKASMEGDKVDAVIDVPTVSAAQIQAFTSNVPMHESVSAHVEAHGPLSDVHASGLLRVGSEGRLTLDAHASLGVELKVQARLRASSIDVRAFVPTLDESNLGMTADVYAVSPKVGPRKADFFIDIPTGRFGKNLVPHASLRGEATQNTETAEALVLAGHVTARIDEEGAPTTLEIDARPIALGEEIRFDVRSKVQLARLARVGGFEDGRGEVTVLGSAVVAARTTIDASARVNVERLARGKNRVQSAEVRLLVKGDVTNPGLKAAVEADAIESSGYRLAQVRAASSGLLHRQDVRLFLRGQENYPSVEAQADVEMKDGVIVHVARAWISRDSDTIAASVGEVKIGSDHVSVKDAKIDDLGPIATASFEQVGERLRAKVNAKDLDLKRLGQILRMEKSIRQGKLGFDIDLDVEGGRGATGHVSAKAKDVCISAIKGANASLALTMEGREVRGDLEASLQDVASMGVHSKAVHIGGNGPMSVDSWRRAWGEVRFDIQGDAAKLAALVPADHLPFSDVSGNFRASGKIARDSESDDTPEVAFSGSTEGLILGTKSGPVVKHGAVDVISPPRSRTTGIDGRIDLQIDGTSGALELSARLVDKHGVLVGLDAKSTDLPFKELLASDDAKSRLAQAPISILINIPRRALEDLPSWMAVAGSGEIDGSLLVTGSAGEPKVMANLRGYSLHVPGMTSAARLEASVVGTYDGAKGRVEVRLRSPEKEVLMASALVEANAKGLLYGQAGLDAWVASAKGTVKDFPLATIGVLADRQVEGSLSGDFSLVDLHKNAHARVDLTIGDLHVGTATFKGGAAAVSLDERGLFAHLRLDQFAGFADVKAKMAMTWGREIAPAIDPKGRADAMISAKGFRLVALQPFVQSQLSELDGKIDAEASFAVEGGAKPKMQGTVKWTDGLLQVNALGEAFHDVHANLTLAPNGQLKIDDMVMSAPSGSVRVGATANLDGLSLASGKGTVSIDKKEAIPLDVSGARIGQLYGQVNLSAETSPSTKQVNVAVQIPSLHVDLPLSSVATVQDLGVPKDEHIGFFTSPSRFVLIPLDEGAEPAPMAPKDSQAAPPTEIKVHFGNDVEVRRGTTLKVVLEGDPDIKLGHETAVLGQIRLKSGSLDVQGKKFDIEKGTVTFVGKDPSNPDVSVTAEWTAEDGTRVFADFIGPLKTGKVTLRSEPARPRNEIVALILFGTADGSQSTPYASPTESDATRVGTTAGGFATEGLSKGLDQLTGMEITTKIDTSNSSNPRPEVELQIARDISVQLAFVLGTPPPGMNPDTTYASIDWRFVRNWSLETTFGNLGSTIADMVWQYRY